MSHGTSFLVAKAAPSAKGKSMGLLRRERAGCGAFLQDLFGNLWRSSVVDSAGHHRIVRKEGRSVALDKIGYFAVTEPAAAGT